MQKLLTLLLLSVALSAGAQQGISVQSFRCLPQDLDARVNHPVTDQNGDNAALIKVVCRETGFKFEAGVLGITKVERKTGEYWVYIPYGSRKITIKHDQLGVLRNYVFPEAIKKATVYELVLTTGKVITTVEETVIPTHYLIITSEPAGATVYIDEQQAGTTTFQRKLPEGEYNYRLELPKYHPAAGKVTLDGSKKQLNIELKPNFGHILVTSSPESNMDIYLDGDHTGKTTPDTLKNISSTTHTVQLRDQWYQSQTKKINVEDEQTGEAHFEMEKAFAELSISTQPAADIFVEDEKVGNGNWSGRRLAGYYNVKIEKEHYYSEEKQVEIVAGEDQSLNFELEGKTGSLDVITEPFNAEIYLNSKKYGNSPLSVNDLLTGEYRLVVKKDGFADIHKKITIQENETLEIEESLQSGKEVSITSTPPGSTLFIDDEERGTTPLTLKLAFGQHEVKVEKEGNSKTEIIDVEQDGSSSFLLEIKKEITITSHPTDAKIHINGVYEGRTPATVLLHDEPVKIKISRDGYRDKTLNLKKLPQDKTISAELDGINLINGYSTSVKVGMAENAGLGSFGNVGLSLFVDRYYLSASLGFTAQPNPFEEEINSAYKDVIVNDIEDYTPAGRYYLGENDYNFSQMQENGGLVFSLQAGYQFSFPFPFVIHAGYGGRKSFAYQHVYQAKHDYYLTDGYAQDMSKGEYFTTPEAYLDGFNSLIIGMDIPVFGFLTIGAEYWTNAEVDDIIYFKAGLLLKN
ncbi:MAG: PEGA domain-containing protein [Bacteroidota bacterium]